MFSKKYYIMTPGPTEIPSEILNAIISEEANLPNYQEIYEEDVKLIEKLLNVKGKTVIMGGGSTVGLEAVISTFIKKDSKTLVLSAGYFGDILEKLVRYYSGNVYVIREKQGKIPSLDRIEDFLKRNNDLEYVVLAHCETSAGTMFNISEITKIVRENSNARIIVDAVSTAGAVPLSVGDEKGVDAVVFGSQKVLNMPPGLAIVTLSENIVENMEKIIARGFYLNLKEWLDFWENKRRLPSTPPVNLLYGLRIAVSRILKEGLENVFRRHVYVSSVLRRILKTMGLRVVAESDEIASPTVTVAYVPSNVSSEKVVNDLWRNYGILISKALGEISEKAIRIGHMGVSATLDHIFAVTYGLTKTLQCYGFKIDLSNVLAAFF